MALPADMPDPVPTVYMTDQLDPGGFFLNSQVWMRNNDIIFVSNAPAFDLQKFLAVLLPFSSSAVNARNIQ
jgi:polysaccharide export outer membrane protein